MRFGQNKLVAREYLIFSTLSERKCRGISCNKLNALEGKIGYNCNQRGREKASIV
jgi:hypothetical protein